MAVPEARKISDSDRNDYGEALKQGDFYIREGARYWGENGTKAEVEQCVAKLIEWRCIIVRYNYVTTEGEDVLSGLETLLGRPTNSRESANRRKIRH